MNTLIAIGAVLGCSTAAWVGGCTYCAARTTGAMIALGWRPPATPTKSENPFRGNGGAK